jgi:C-terminal processing protease CtpA/Prc
MKWMAYTFSESNDAWNIWIVPVAGGTPINVTNLNAYHSLPTWSPDGKYLFFESNRDGDGLYVLPLQREPGRLSDFDIKFEKPKDPVNIDIDFQDIKLRIRKLSSQDPNEDLTVTEDGKILFISEGDIWSVSYDGTDTKRLTTDRGCSNLRILKGNEKAFFARNGELWTIKIEDPGKQDRVSFSADCDRDIKAERKAAFTQFWRSYNRLFYDPNMHGRDWNAIRTRYEPLLDAVETREEFATLLSMMVGELECSHAEVGAAWGGNTSPVTPHLGFTFDYSYQGPGIRVLDVPIGAPGSFTQTQIKPGEYVISINGQDVRLDETLFKFINDKQDREFTFLVNSVPAHKDARTVKYTSMSWREWSDLDYRNRVERLRKYVDEQSDGKIGYVHISGMMDDNQTRFEREFYEYALGKEAMIIDVRFNGGGYIGDNLIDWLERKPHGYQSTRDAEPRINPRRTWSKPVAVLINECSYSNAEMFPSAMKARELATVVGIPTPGYVIATLPLPLVDGTWARMPFVGQYRLDGTPMENNGEQPDVLVTLEPDDWVNHCDPQLDKALELMKKQM